MNACRVAGYCWALPLVLVSVPVELAALAKKGDVWCRCLAEADNELFGSRGLGRLEALEARAHAGQAVGQEVCRHGHNAATRQQRRERR